MKINHSLVVAVVTFGLIQGFGLNVADSGPANAIKASITSSFQWLGEVTPNDVKCTLTELTESGNNAAHECTD